MVVTDKQTWRWKTRCSTEVAQRKMNRPINSGKRVESIDFQTSRVDRQNRLKSSRSIDRVGRFSLELSRFVRLDRFQGLVAVCVCICDCVATVCVWCADGDGISTPDDHDELDGSQLSVNHTNNPIQCEQTFSGQYSFSTSFCIFHLFCSHSHWYITALCYKL